MKEAIEKLTEAALKVHVGKGRQEESITSACIDITFAFNDPAKVEFKVWCDSRFHIGASLDEAVEKAMAFNSKQEKLTQAAELRAKAAQLEQEAA